MVFNTPERLLEYGFCHEVAQFGEYQIPLRRYRSAKDSNAQTDTILSSLSKTSVRFPFSKILPLEPCWLSPNTLSYLMNGKWPETSIICYFPRFLLLLSLAIDGQVYFWNSAISGTRFEDVNKTAKTAIKQGLLSFAVHFEACRLQDWGHLLLWHPKGFDFGIYA